MKKRAARWNLRPHISFPVKNVSSDQRIAMNRKFEAAKKKVKI